MTPPPHPNPNKQNSLQLPAKMPTFIILLKRVLCYTSHDLNMCNY